MPFSVGVLVGKVEAILGGILNKPALKEKGLAKQKAAADKTAAPAATTDAPTTVPQHTHDTPEEQLAAEGGPNEVAVAGGGGRPAA